MNIQESIYELSDFNTNLGARVENLLNVIKNQTEKLENDLENICDEYISQDDKNNLLETIYQTQSIVFILKKMIPPHRFAEVEDLISNLMFNLKTAS